MTSKQILSWLLTGDVSIQYQVYNGLLGIHKPQLQNKIEKEGWGLRFLNKRKPNGHWGIKFYQPKWTSTHYTLLDLKNLQISPANKLIRDTLKIILENEKAKDGGICPVGSSKQSDVCINGMVLNYASYFKSPAHYLESIVDALLNEKMSDGGFNCQLHRKGAVHSSLHTTLSVLEGIFEYERNGYTYRLSELKEAEKKSREFILIHHLFKSDKTAEIINPAFLRFRYPCRWHYDILRAMDYFRLAGVKYDDRMEDALTVILKKRDSDGRWKLPSPYPGHTHFEMEEPGKPSRWNTLRALRTLTYYNKIDFKP